MNTSIVCILGALTLEGASLWQLGGTPTRPLDPSGFIGLHTLASLVGSKGVVGFLPVRYRQPAWAGHIFFFLLLLCMPLFGLLGITAGLLPALWRQRIPSRPLDCLYSKAPKLRTIAGCSGHIPPIAGEGQLM
ncbi:MAG: hypothetical protein ACREWI_07685, partial [Telluria sp.]